LRADFQLGPTVAFQRGLIIECKWQDVGGSADEKLPYLVANIRERFPMPAIVIVDGHGMRAQAVEWLRRQVDGDRLVGVFDLGQFVSWLQRTLAP